MDPLSFQKRKYETVRAERDELRAEVEKVNGFREDLRRKFNVRGDRLNEALDHIESLRAKLATVEAQLSHCSSNLTASRSKIGKLEGQNKSLLAQLEEARWLLGKSGDSTWSIGFKESLEWLKRRDAWLSGHTASERLGKEAK